MTVNDCVSITEITLILVIEENGTRKVARSLIRRMKIRIVVRPLYDRVTDVKSFDIKPSLHIRVNRFYGFKIDGKRRFCRIRQWFRLRFGRLRRFGFRLRLLCFLWCRCLRCFCNFRRILLQIPVFIRAGLVIQVNADQLVPGKAENSKCR